MTGKRQEIAATEDRDMSLLTQAPDDWEFSTEVAEAPIQVELELGESIVLYFEGIEHIVPDGAKTADDAFDLLTFTGRDGVRYAMNPGYKLDRYFRSAEPAWYRITLIKELPTGRGLNPMKDYKVEKKK